MASLKRIKYLKKDRGRYYYQRRVPNDLQDLLGEILWRRPCGDVDYAKAIQLVVTWSEEHDDFIKELKSPSVRQQLKTKNRRAAEAAYEKWVGDGVKLYADYSDSDRFLAPIEDIPHPWKTSLSMLKELEIEHRNHAAPEYHINQLRARIERHADAIHGNQTLTLVPYPELIAIVEEHKDDPRLPNISFLKEIPELVDEDEFLDRLKELYECQGRRKSRPLEVMIDGWFMRAPWDQQLLTKQAGSRAHCPCGGNS